MKKILKNLMNVLTRFLQYVDEKQHWELVSVTPSVTNSIESVDYFITIVYKNKIVKEIVVI